MVVGSIGKYKMIHTATQNNKHKVIIFDHKDTTNINIVARHSFKGDETNSGLFHLAEHLLFGKLTVGGQLFEIGTEAMNFLSKKGVYVNARTGTDGMYIEATIETPKVHPKMQWVRKFVEYKDAVDLAIDFLTSIHTPKKLTDVALKREKNIVISELNMYGEDAYKDECVESYMLGTKHNTLGTIEEINATTKTKIQNILNHIHSGELLEHIIITCDMSRHEEAVNRIINEINIDSSVCAVTRPRKNSKTGAVTGGTTKIEKYNISHVCDNIPKGHAKIKDVEPVMLSDKPTKLYVTMELGCNFKKSESLLNASKKQFMLQTLSNQMFSSSNFGILHVLREVHGLIYGFSYRITRAEKAPEYHNIPGLSKSICAYASIGITDFDEPKIKEIKDLIFNEVLSTLSENYINSITPEYFKEMMNTRIAYFSNVANYVNSSTIELDMVCASSHHIFMSNFYKQRLDSITREEYIMFVKDVLSKIQWNVIAI